MAGAGALLPVPFFEGPEKRVEIRYVVADEQPAAGGGGGMRNVPASFWSASLAKAGITIESSVHGPEWDCYMLSESSLFVTRDRIICKTCGQSAPLAIIDDALTCADSVGAQPALVLFSRSDLLRPAEQVSAHRSFEAECRFLNAVLPRTAVANAVVLGDTEDAHWAVFLASLPAATTAPGYVPPTLEMAMYDLDPANASVWWEKNVGTAEEARHRSGLNGVLPTDSTIDEMLFAPCGYSMNCFDNRTGAHATVHVTPQQVCSFASYECTVLDPTAVGATIRSVIDVFRPGRFSISLIDLAGSELEETAALPTNIGPADSCDYAVSAQHLERLACGGISGTQVFASFLQAPVDSSLDHVAQQWLPEPVTELTNFLAAHGVPLIEDSATRTVQQMFQQQISENNLDAPFYVADLGVVEKQVRLWQKLLPRVEPRYAIKCNPDEVLLGTLHAVGCGFDVASEEELRFALKAGARCDEIVFANPVKSLSCIDYARKHGVGLTTFDSAAELKKLAEHWPDAQLLLRISTDDSGAACQLSNKYGAQLGDEVHSLILLARSLQLDIVGVAFHCGSGQTQSIAFGRSIVDAAAVFTQLRLFGFKPHVLDIGGGFPGEESGEAAATFDEIAASVITALNAHFPEQEADQSGCPQLRVIAEPGRFFAHAAFTLACNIIGKKDRQRPERVTGEEPFSQDAIACSYTIGDGIYGSFNCLLYDHAVAHPLPLQLHDHTAFAHSGDWVLSTVFGPTCDGLDCVCEQVRLPADLLPGRDWLLFEGMGAYTLAAGSPFNGIQRAQILYVYNTKSAYAVQMQDEGIHLSSEEEKTSALQAVMVPVKGHTTTAQPLPLRRSRL